MEKLFCKTADSILQQEEKLWPLLVFFNEKQSLLGPDISTGFQIISAPLSIANPPVSDEAVHDVSCMYLNDEYSVEFGPVVAVQRRPHFDNQIIQLFVQFGRVLF